MGDERERRRPRTPWFVAVAVLVALCALLLYGSTRHTPDHAGSASPDGTVSTFAADVVEVRRTGERSLTVVAELPAGGPDCARDLRVTSLQDELPDRPDTIYVTVVYTGLATATCPERRTAGVALRVKEPLADRVLQFNSSNPAWAPAGDRYRECEEILGCSPPQDPCHPVWIDQAVYYLDVPVKRLRSVRQVRGCDGAWLVLDVDRAVGACPPDGGHCDPGPEVVRWFLRFVEFGWTTVQTSNAEGCAGVDERFDDFPMELCADLAAPGR